MNNETFTSLAGYTCAECGEVNNAQCWSVPRVCDDFRAFYDYCSGCASITMFIEYDGCILSIGTYENSSISVREMMTVAGQHQRDPWLVGAGWDVENQRLKPGWHEDEIPF